MALEQVELGNLIRKKRKSLGLTLSDLAGENISVPTISNIERGVVHNVSDDKIAYLLDKLGLDEKALAEMKQSDVEERNDIELELSIIHNLIETRIFDIARERILELERQERVSHHEDLVVKLQLAKAQLYRRQEQWERSARAFRRVIQMAGETELDPKWNIEAETYHCLAQCVMYSEEDYEKAIHYSSLALDALEKEGVKPYLEGRIYFDKAVYHYHLEAYAPAFECVQKAQELSLQTKDMRTAALAYNLEGAILKRQKIYKKATALYKKAIDICTTYFPDKALASTLHLNMGDNYLLAKEYDAALQCFNIAHDLVKSTKDKGVLSLVYCSFVEVYFELGDYDQADEYVDKILPLMKDRDATHIDLEYLRFLLIRARIALHKEDEEALFKICNEGIEVAEKTNKYHRLKEFHFILANYYDKIGDREKFIQETGRMYFVEKMQKEG